MKQAINYNYIGQLQYQPFAKFMRNYLQQDILVDIFTIANTQLCKRQEKEFIEKEIVKSIKSNFGIYCALCRKDLNRKYNCPNCFGKQKDPSNYLCVFVDQPPSTQLVSFEVNTEKNPVQKIQGKVFKKPESEVVLNEKEKEVFESLRNNFFMGNTDLIDFIAGELHLDSGEKEKAFIVEKIYYLSKQRQENYKKMKKIVRKYEERRLSKQFFFSQDQDSSINQLGLPLVPLEQLTSMSKKIVEDIDSLTKRNGRMMQNKSFINQMSKPNKKYNKK